MPTNMIHPQRLREARGDKTLIEVHRDTGVSRGLISRLERGQRPSARIDTICKLAEYYGVTIAYLLGEE